MGSEALGRQLKAELEAQGKRPYVIPVGAPPLAPPPHPPPSPLRPGPPPSQPHVAFITWGWLAMAEPRCAGEAGGSNSLGCWGYLEAVAEMQAQCPDITDIAMVSAWAPLIIARKSQSGCLSRTPPPPSPTSLPNPKHQHNIC